MSTADPLCPACQQGRLSLKHARDGHTFYGCSEYPLCKFTAKRKPLPLRCPGCSSLFLEEWSIRGILWARCPNKNCRYEKRLSSF